MKVLISCFVCNIIIALLSVSEEVRTKCHLSPVDPAPALAERLDVFAPPHSLLQDISSGGATGYDSSARSLPGAVSTVWQK